jgi:hypothetical protein
MLWINQFISSFSLMTLVVHRTVVATARFSQHAAADGTGAWIVSTHPARLFSRNQAITALALADRLAAGYGYDDPFVREELARGAVPVTDRLIRITTALAVVAVAGVAAIIPTSTPTSWSRPTARPV